MESLARKTQRSLGTQRLLFFNDVMIIFGAVHQYRKSDGYVR